MSMHLVSGTIQKDLEVGKTSGGTTVVKMAIPEKRQTAKGEKTFWYNVSAYGKTAEFIINNFRKGTVVELMTQPDLSESNGKAYLNWNVLPVIGSVKPLANFGGNQNANSQPASPQNNGYQQNEQQPAHPQQNNQPGYQQPPAGYNPNNDDDDVPF